MFEKWLTRAFILMDEVGGGSGGGGAGGSALTGGSGPAGGSSGGGTGGDGAGGGKPAGAAGGDPAGGGGAAADWRAALPEGLRENADLGRYKSVDELGNAYINLRKHLSGEKLVVPGKQATDEDWMGVYKKLGLPETLDKYEVKFKEDSKVDKEFTDQFRTAAHKLGVLPRQAQALADWFSDLNKGAVEKHTQAYQAKVKADLDGLQKEWGDGFKKNLSKASRVVHEFKEDFPDLGKALDETGAGNNPHVIKAFAKIADLLWKEDALVDGGPQGGTGMTPAEAKAAAGKIMGDMNHPYWLKDHPNHKAAVKEMSELIAAQNPK